MTQYNSLLKAGLLIFLLATSVSSQAKQEATKAKLLFPDFGAESAGPNFDAEKIAVLESRMKQFVSDGDTMGITTLLVHDGKVISHTQAGVRDLVDGKAIEQDTIYRIYSMTKPITGVAMMMLYEQGKFSLDDPVTKFIPEFENLEVVKSFEKDGSFEIEPLERQPTMRELMSHTAGFGYGLYGDDPTNKAFMKQGVLASPDLQTLIDKVSAIPLMFQPGEKWFYSIAVDIQGAIIERITGMTLAEFFASKLFVPLGMSDTAFYVPPSKADRFSDVFAYHPETKKFQRMPFAEEKYNWLGDMSFSKETRGMESGGGGLVSTLADYARFCQMLANGGELDGVRYIKPETLKLMRTNVLKEGQSVTIAGTLSDTPTDALGFGLNFGVIESTDASNSSMGNGSYFGVAQQGLGFGLTQSTIFISLV